MNKNSLVTIYLGSDHAGYFMKQRIAEYLRHKNFDILDFGPDTHNENDDYPDFLHPLAFMLSQHSCNNAFVFGGSGAGEAMVLNRYEHVRCVQYSGGDIELISLAREHNNANAISFASRFLSEHEIKKAIDIFLETHFNHEQRHERRIKKIESLLADNSRDYTKE